MSHRRTDIGPFDFPIDDRYRNPAFYIENDDGTIDDDYLTPHGRRLPADVFPQYLKGALLFSWTSWSQANPSLYPDRWPDLHEAMGIVIDALRAAIQAEQGS